MIDTDKLHRELSENIQLTKELIMRSKKQEKDIQKLKEELQSLEEK